MRHVGASTLFLSRLALKILAILLLCGVLPAFVIGLRWLNQDKTIRKERVDLALGTQLVRCKANIDAWMGERLRDATRSSSAYIVFDAVEAILRSGDDAARARQSLSEYLQFVVGNTRVYESLFVVDLQGHVLASTRTERLEQAVRHRLRGDGDLARGVVISVQRSEVLERPTLLALHAIRGRRGTTLAFLVERIDLRELDPLVRHSGGDLPLSVWLLDRDGVVVVRSIAVPSGPEPNQLLLDASRSDVVADAKLPDSTLLRYVQTSLDAPLDGRLAVTIRAAEAERPARDSRGRVLNLALLGVGVMLVAFVWATRGVLRPILFLSEGARRLSAGDLNVFLPVWGRDEIGALTATFNEMIRRLREGRETIEDARDELARANEDLRAANQTLEALAITDGLTGLYNHRHFQDTLEREIRRCDREGRPLSLLMLDIDHFKQFNDRWGHTEGDAALRRVAGQMMKTIRTSDSAFRYGGEELALLLPGCMKEQAREVAEKVRLAVEDSWTRRGAAGPRLTVSIGVATSPEDARVARALVDAADGALYAAKAQGRNCVVVAGTDDGAALSEA